MAKVKIELNATGTDGSVRIDGQEIAKSVRMVDIHAQVGEPATVTLELGGAPGVTFDGEANIQVSPVIHRMLVEAGWMPPGRFPPAIRPHGTCLDVSTMAERPGSSWVCGAGCLGVLPDAQETRFKRERLGVWPESESHQHRASCHGPAGELQCGYR